jgi:hypothetical protein
VLAGGDEAGGKQQEHLALPDCLARPLPPEQSAALARLWAHDLSFVRDRVVREGVMPRAVVEQAELEYRKFMALSIVDDEEHAMFSPEVDEFWHAHLMFTRDYAQFCDSVFQRFIHHEPLREDERGEDLDPGPEWQQFVRAYAPLFGSPSFLWGPDRMRQSGGE